MSARSVTETRRVQRDAGGRKRRSGSLRRRCHGYLSVLWLAAFCSTAHEASAQEWSPSPIARATLATEPPIIVGQPVTVQVEVLVPTWFTRAPDWPNVDLAHALTIFQWSGGHNLSERIDGQTWAGQSRSYIVYPQKPGRYEIVEIPVEVFYSRDGSTVSATASPAPIAFEAVLPPEAAGLPYFISTTALEMTQTLDPAPDTLRVGEAFRRSITVTVRDAMGMVIPPIPTEPIAGIGVYHDPPTVDETYPERGATIIGRRIETATYVAETPGSYELPAIELAWWDLAREQISRSTLSSIPLTVIASPLTSSMPWATNGSEAEEATPSQDGVPAPLSDWIRRWCFPALLLTALLWGAWRVVPLTRPWRRRLGTRMAEAREARAESEPAYFARFRQAAGAGNATATWQALTSWLDRFQQGPGVPSVRGLARISGDPVLADQIDALDQAIFGVGGAAVDTSWSGTRLYDRVAHWRAHHRSRSRFGTKTLHALNPSSASRLSHEGE